jgi:hypothetical protein
MSTVTRNVVKRVSPETVLVLIELSNITLGDEHRLALDAVLFEQVT